MQEALFICGNERHTPKYCKIWVDPLNFRICCDHCKSFLTFATATHLLTGHLGLSLLQQESLQRWEIFVRIYTNCLLPATMSIHYTYPSRWAQNVQ